jgi:hypothetical protein
MLLISQLSSDKETEAMGTLSAACQKYVLPQCVPSLPQQLERLSAASCSIFDDTC